MFIRLHMFCNTICCNEYRRPALRLACLKPGHELEGVRLGSHGNPPWDPIGSPLGTPGPQLVRILHNLTEIHAKMHHVHKINEIYAKVHNLQQNSV